MSTGTRTASIVGVGHTDFSKDSGRSEYMLAVQAIRAALADAGIEPASVDGLVRYDMDSNDDNSIISALGFKNLGWMSQTAYGGTGGNAVIAHAAAAIQAGLANTIVCFRALNERSGRRYGQAELTPRISGIGALQQPYGMISPVHKFAPFAQRYLYEYNETPDAFGHVAVALRDYATRNPNAMMQKPITLDDHANSRTISSPLRLFDCCIESDGAAAVVVTRSDLADSSRAVSIAAASQGSGANPWGIVFRSTLAQAEAAYTAEAVFRQAGITPDDVDVAMVYDHFTPFVLFALEAYGFCKPGEAGDFVRDGQIGPGGRLPVNTHGGNHSEAYIHGLTHVIEAVRQLRGESVNQVKDVDVVLSCSAVAQLSAAVILTKGS